MVVLFTVLCGADRLGFWSWSMSSQCQHPAVLTMASQWEPGPTASLLPFHSTCFSHDAKANSVISFLNKSVVCERYFSCSVVKFKDIFLSKSCNSKTFCMLDTHLNDFSILACPCSSSPEKRRKTHCTAPLNNNLLNCYSTWCCGSSTGHSVKWRVQTDHCSLLYLPFDSQQPPPSQEFMAVVDYAKARDLPVFLVVMPIW